jgi:Domain of unknown function (DUF4157)
VNKCDIMIDNRYYTKNDENKLTMSKAFIDRTQQQNVESNQTETSQKKIDPVAQLKWINSQQVDQGWDIPAQMFAQEEEEEPVQGKAEEEELMQGKAEEEELQMKVGPEGESEKHGSSGTKTGMPDEVRSKMENSFGTDFSGVNIHQNSEKASNIGALAYTQGNNIVFAGGQYQPNTSEGQKLLGHELAHVVQQRQGRVRPDAEQHKGMNINSDTALEKEADVMGEKAAQGKMANVAGKGSGVQRKTANFPVPKGWGLDKIASHLKVSVQELKDLNKDKLKTWGDVQGFNTGEVIVYPLKSDAKEENKIDAKKIIEQAYKDYENDSISMPELARALLPYVSSHAYNIGVIFYKLNVLEKDNLSYALASNSPKDSDLENFDKNLLKAMSTFLDTYMTMSRGDNLIQKKRIDKILNRKITSQALGLNNIIGNKKGEEEKIKQIITYVRKQFEEYPPKVKALKESKNLTPDKKVKIFGKLSAEAAKLEFLMGTIFHKREKWEDKKGKSYLNKGFMVDHYTKQSSYDGKPVAAAWCTKFATTVLSSVLGIRAQHKYDGESRRGAWGGSQIANGHENFWDYDEKKGGKFIGQSKLGETNKWKDLKNKVKEKKSKTEKIKRLKTFFKNNITPQSGDIMISDPGGNNSYHSHKAKNFDSSHTTLVEKFHLTESEAYIYTVEGNSGQQVSGRRYDLTKTSGNYSLAAIVNIARMSLDNYGRSSNIGNQVDITASKSSNINEDSLLKPLIQMSNILQDYGTKLGYINKGEKGSTAFELMKGNNSTSIQ